MPTELPDVVISNLPLEGHGVRGGCLRLGTPSYSSPIAQSEALKTSPGPAPHQWWFICVCLDDEHPYLMPAKNSCNGSFHSV